MVKVQKGGLTLPARVKERQYDRDDQRREAVPLLAGEGRMVIRRLTEGAHGVRKIIEIRKQRGRGHATVEARWETVAAPPSGPELWKIMEATAEADWPQDVRVALGEKVAEIRRLGEAQGDQGPPTPSLGGPTLSGLPTRRCATERKRTPCGRRPEWPSSS